MTTKLEKELKREITIGGEPYTVTISPAGVKLSAKGKRKGQELAWKDMLNGQPGSNEILSSSLEQTHSSNS
jgi:hypothetical protein